MPPRERGRRQPRGPSGRDADEQLPWAVIYYRAPDETVPTLEFLDDCRGTIDAQFTAVLDAVAAAPPPRFSGGGKWEAMHGSMGGWYEIRLTGPSRSRVRVAVGAYVTTITRHQPDRRAANRQSAKT